MNDLEIVAMTLHESVHFTMNSTGPLQEAEWETLTKNPDGLGRVRLGPDNRVLTAVFAHQLHCIRQIERAFIDRDHNISSPHHVSHCLNYLRQTFLCDAADTIEEGDFMKRNLQTDRVGDTLICWDWERVYEEMGLRHRWNTV